MHFEQQSLRKKKAYGIGSNHNENDKKTQLKHANIKWESHIFFILCVERLLCHTDISFSTPYRKHAHIPTFFSFS